MMAFFQNLHRYAVCFAAFLQFVGAQECNIIGALSCPHYNELKRGFTQLLPLENTESKCRAARVGLDCILSPSYTKNCHAMEVVDFHRKDKLVRALCEEYSFAFELSKPCFKNKDLQQDVDDCLLEFINCGFEDTQQCLEEAVLQYDDVCDKTDAALMVYLVGEFVKPLTQAPKTCTWEELDTTGIVTPAKPETTTRATTPVTTPSSTASSQEVTTVFEEQVGNRSIHHIPGTFIIYFMAICVLIFSLRLGEM